MPDSPSPPPPNSSIHTTATTTSSSSSNSTYSHSHLKDWAWVSVSKSNSSTIPPDPNNNNNKTNTPSALPHQHIHHPTLANSLFKHLTAQKESAQLDTSSIHQDIEIISLNNSIISFPSTTPPRNTNHSFTDELVENAVHGLVSNENECDDSLNQQSSQEQELLLEQELSLLSSVNCLDKNCDCKQDDPVHSIHSILQSENQNLHENTPLSIHQSLSSDQDHITPQDIKDFVDTLLKNNNYANRNNSSSNNSRIAKKIETPVDIDQYRSHSTQDYAFTITRNLYQSQNHLPPTVSTAVKSFPEIVMQRLQLLQQEQLNMHDPSCTAYRFNNDTLTAPDKEQAKCTCVDEELNSFSVSTEHPNSHQPTSAPSYIIPRVHLKHQQLTRQHNTDYVLNHIEMPTSDASSYVHLSHQLSHTSTTSTPPPHQISVVDNHSSTLVNSNIYNNLAHTKDPSILKDGHIFSLMLDKSSNHSTTPSSYSFISRTTSPVPLGSVHDERLSGNGENEGGVSLKDVVREFENAMDRWKHTNETNTQTQEFESTQHTKTDMPLLRSESQRNSVTLNESSHDSMTIHEKRREEEDQVLKSHERYMLFHETMHQIIQKVVDVHSHNDESKSSRQQEFEWRNEMEEVGYECHECAIKENAAHRCQKRVILVGTNGGDSFEEVIDVSLTSSMVDETARPESNDKLLSGVDSQQTEEVVAKDNIKQDVQHEELTELKVQKKCTHPKHIKLYSCQKHILPVHAQKQSFDLTSFFTTKFDAISSTLMNFVNTITLSPILPSHHLAKIKGLIFIEDFDNSENDKPAKDWRKFMRMVIMALGIGIGGYVGFIGTMKIENALNKSVKFLVSLF